MPEFTLLHRKDIDDDRWNGVVRSHPGFCHYPLTYFLDNACDHWSALVGHRYEWVWPLPERTFPIKRVHQPLLAQQLGPYGRKLSDHEFQEIWKYLNARYMQVRTKFNDIYTSLPVRSEAHVNIELDLSRSYEELSGAYNRNVRSNLKKAEKASVKIAVDTDFNPWGIQTFRSGKAQHLNDLDASFFQQVEHIYKAFASKQEAGIYSAYYEGIIVAQLMLLTAKQRILLFFSATNEVARDVGAMHAIIDRVICEYSGSPIVFDFEGSDNPQLAFFYKSFGGAEKVYLQAESDRLIWPLNRLLK